MYRTNIDSINGGEEKPNTNISTDNIHYTIRKLTPIECERLQGLPDNYTAGISNTQRYKCLGNAFNVDVVAHILSFIGAQPYFGELFEQGIDNLG